MSHKADHFYFYITSPNVDQISYFSLLNSGINCRRNKKSIKNKTEKTYEVHHCNISSQRSGWTNQKHILPQLILLQCNNCYSYTCYTYAILYTITAKTITIIKLLLFKNAHFLESVSALFVFEKFSCNGIPKFSKLRHNMLFQPIAKNELLA